MTRTQRFAKFLRLTEIYGAHEPEFWFKQNFSDGKAQGICTIPGCEFTATVDFFEKAGHCDRCNRMTVVSGILLYGIEDPYDTPYHRELDQDPDLLK